MTNGSGVGNILQDEKEDVSMSFNIFSPQEIETNMESAITIRIKPISGGNSSNGPFDFLVPSMGKEYCLMNFTSLEEQLKITKENGDDL